MVGGGGGGSGGGGGGGGVLYQAQYVIGAFQTINIIVGAGGDSTPNRYFASPNGSNGGDSSFGSIIAYGGGGGGAVGLGGSSGASSGGAGFDTAAITGAATQGYAGANGAANDGYVAAGGGGGAGGLGTRGLYGLDGYGWATSSSPGGNGGIGLAYNISGVENYYGGGGGGGANTNSAATTIGGLGGLGGGGDGARANNGQGIAGIANTGGGGGGGDFEGQGAAGGSGIVIVRYVGATSTTSTTSSIISTIEDTAKSIQGIQITDSDSTNVTVTFTHSAGTLSVDTNVANGLGASAVSGNGTATLVLNGTVAQINATLAASSGLIYTPTANFNGNATLTMTTNDGVGGIDSDTLAMTVTAVNDIPTLTSFTAAVATTNEDTAVEITLADLLAQGNESDVDGSVTAFVVKSVTSGILKIGTSSANATAWNASTNAIVDATNKAYWTPVLDANGILNAFTAVAKDNEGAESTTAITVTVNVTAVNDAPLFQSVIFSENFDALDGNKNGGQYLTNEPVQYNATLPGWTSSGAGALHVVGRGGAGTSNDALMIYHDNKATLTTGISANAAGNIYTVSFDVAPAVYQDAGQVTTASDELRITILNSSGGTLKEFSIAPGAFTADASYRSSSFSYVGDGSGDVRIQIDNKTPNNGRFSGAIDNLSITSTGGGSSIRSITDTSATDSFAVVNGRLEASDVDANTTLTYSIDGGSVVGGTTTKVGTYGTLVLTTSTGAYTYTPNNAAINALTANTSESFTFGVSDGTVTTTADLVVNLVAANDTPIVVNIAPVVYTNTNAVDVFANTTGTISASDADANAVLVYGISGQEVVISNGSATLAGQYGTLSIVTATGEYSYAPNQNQLDR